MNRLLGILVILGVTSGANILCVFVIPMLSHQKVYHTVCRELSLRGHKVTVVTPNPARDAKLTNVTEIDVSFVYDHVKHGLVQSAVQSTVSNKMSAIVEIKRMYHLLEIITIAELTYSPVQNILNNKSASFDVVIVDFFHTAMYAFSARFQCPLIGISSMDIFITGHDVVGNPSHPVLNPDMLLPYGSMDKFMDRLASAVFAVWVRWYYNYFVLPKQDAVARKYITSNMPYLGDIEKNVSLLLLNVNPILHSIRPTVPATIQLGNLYVEDTTPLPNDLQIELDNAKNGAVYFSLGSHLKSMYLPSELIQKIVDALSEIPFKVFLKWEANNFPNKTKKFVIRKWFPQKSLLAHKNLKVFVTHGGLQSVEEAIFNNVPLVVIPFRIDQFTNGNKMEQRGAAKVINWETLSKDKLKNTIIQVATNESYKQSIKKVAELLLDVPMTGLEKAVWWIEYVIRHKGADHLRSSAIDLPLYQYLLIDVITFMLIVTIVTAFILYKITILLIYLIKKPLAQNKIKVH